MSKDNTDLTRSDKRGTKQTEESTATALEQWLKQEEGMELSPMQGDQALRCDYCGGSVHRDTRTTFYASTFDMNEHTAVNEAGESGMDLGFQALYCNECDREEIRFPHQGTLEILTEQTVTADMRLVDWGIRAYSLSDEGVAWDPVEVMNTHIHADFVERVSEGRMRNGGYVAVGPEDVINTLTLFDIDPREAIADDGETVKDPEMVARSGEKISTSEAENAGESKSEFTRRMRN